MTEPTVLRILIVDDHAVFRESVARFLGAETGFEVVGHCASVEDAVAIVRRHHVDIVLLDIDLGRRDGSQFLELSRHQGFQGKVLVVTAGIEAGQAAELVRQGVAGIFMKHKSAALLTDSIREVMAGNAVFDQALLQRAFAGQDSMTSSAPTSRFTSRERRVLGGVLEGLANKEVAARLSVSESSVKATLQQLFAKTGVRTRAQLVRIALEQRDEWEEPPGKSVL